MANSPRFVRFFKLWCGTNWPEIKSSLIQRAVTWHHPSHLADLADEQTAPGTKLGAIGQCVWITLGSVDQIGQCGLHWAVCVDHIG